MSETQTATPPVPIQNFVVSDPTPFQANGTTYPCRTITFGEPARTLRVRDLDESDQWDISELGGDNTMNAMWMARTSAVWGIVEIDGMPQPAIGAGSATNRAGSIRATLRKIGRDGVVAVWRMMQLRDASAADAAPDDLAVAKN